MDTLVLPAINAIFIIAGLAPLALVILYRWKEVPLRRTEIQDIMSAAFDQGDEASKTEARAALANNPYVSDPNQTFDRYHNGWRYVFPLFLLTTLAICYTYLGHSWVQAKLVPTIPAPLADRLPTVVIMALAGGLVWSLYQIVSRIRGGALGPGDLYEIALGLLVAVPVGYAFSLVTAELEGVRSFMAFAASAFPVRELSRLVRQYATRRMLESSPTTSSRPAERHLGTAIEGLSDETLTRLGELGIATVLDMAYSDPIKIMVQTGFALPLIIDWTDQSIWALYSGDLKSELNKQGIRCSLDVSEFVDMHLLDGNGQRRTVLEGPHKVALDAIAGKMGVDQSLVQDLFFRIYVDPQVVVLRKLWYPRGLPKELRPQ
ncbi:MAG: hypothetical protein LAO55_22755 [Acidobacteriia bacterium]|nr:hypothetical protein [Terriglobia bacterium]